MSTTSRKLKAFAVRHDYSPAFHATYLALTILISAMLNLGAFVLLIAGHMALDTVKYRETHGMRWKLVARGVIRESLIDVVLLVIGFASVVYLHHGVGLAAASGLLRSQATLIQGVILVTAKSRILFDVLCVLNSLPQHMQTVLVHPKKPWSAFECFLFGVLGACLVLLLVLPLLIGLPMEVLQKALDGQMVPWHI
jgi:hypothetical protein